MTRGWREGWPTGNPEATPAAGDEDRGLQEFDLEQLLQKVSDEAPCGEDLEADAEFGALERAATAVPERVAGEVTIPAQEPDWADVAARALRLFQRTKDLRVVLTLAHSLLKTQGLPGYRNGLMLVERLVGGFWDQVHPQLDPDDALDPTMRLNILAAICDGESLLKEVRAAPLAVSRGFGVVSYRDVLIANKELKPVAEEAPREMRTLRAAFMDCDASLLQANTSAAKDLLVAVRSIDGDLREKVGEERAPDFTPAIKLLTALSAFLEERCNERGLTDVPATATREPTATFPDVPVVSVRPAVLAVGEIDGRDDVVRLLERICAWYRAHEPSSPVPILLERAKRLVPMDFFGVLKDIAPDAVAQAETLRGAVQAEATE